MFKLGIVIASVREGRVGLPVADWCVERARRHARFDTALVNALDYLYVEWNYKAAAFVSYGGMSGGIRAVQMTKLSLATLKIVPIVEAVTIPFVSQAIDRESGAFKASEQHDKAAATMFDELHRWTTALAPLRA